MKCYWKVSKNEYRIGKLKNENKKKTIKMFVVLENTNMKYY